MYCIMGLRTPAYSSLYLSNFLCFNTLNDEIFSSKISEKLCKLE